ncbi:hypothetical protein J113_21550 [Mycobacterium tuberculosis CAS/NITR204]|uniref:Uncharacterized protein n=1 Tax=Mycobacterium tuberculosis CAS/NITR204 TaxID=1310114 RepID=R4MCE7_MYCTX|nr:hypothetical protein J113_21550 [Mycobacterium tuberculosis CAS/NITR204]
MRLSSIAFGAEYWLAPSGFTRAPQNSVDRFLFNVPGAVDALCVTQSRRREEGLHGEQLGPSADPGDGPAHHAIFGEHTLVSWKAPRRPALRQPALPRKGAEVLRAGHGTRDRKALATWPMGEEVRFRDRAGPIALDIVAEVIFGAPTTRAPSGCERGQSPGWTPAAARGG